MEDFDLILKDIQEVMKKHGVEMRIKSELTFVKVDGDYTGEKEATETDKKAKGIRK